MGGVGRLLTTPSVSVLLPVRDGERHLARALNSISRQTFADFEVIAVDDGSKDRTPDILRDLARSDSRLRVVRQPPTGLVAALVRATDEARGALLARMDSDDLAEPERFERQVELVGNDPSLGLAGCRVRYFPREVVRDGARRYESWLNRCRSHYEIERDAFVECPVAHPSFMMRAELVRRVGGYRDMGWPEDYDLFLRLLRAGARFGKAPETLLRWREGPERLSRNDQRYSRSAFLRCKVHHLVRHRPALSARPVVVWGAGPTGKKLAGELSAAGIAVSAFAEVHPRRIGEAIRGAPVLDPEEAAERPDAYHLAAVAQPGGRDGIRKTLAAAGLEELEDFVAVA